MSDVVESVGGEAAVYWGGGEFGTCSVQGVSPCNIYIEKKCIDIFKTKNKKRYYTLIVI